MKERRFRLERPYIQHIFSLEMALALIAIIAIVVLVLSSLYYSNQMPMVIIAGMVFVLSITILLILLLDPDPVRARQTDSMLRLSSRMVGLMENGMNPESAQKMCELLLPSTVASAIAITNRETILGYAGFLAADNLQGSPIRTQATHEVVADGEPRFIYSAQEIGFPSGDTRIKGAIIVPLKVGRETKGTLKFYYRKSRKITETQKSIAMGFGELLSTQISAHELERQRELSTAMELKMLQSQINPHFLFNTINTIASLIRTDAPKARDLLRDFAVFYRSTLENSQEKIKLEKEIEQTARYFSFEVARFGEDALELLVVVDDQDKGQLEMLVPPFLLQPIVENAVKHAKVPNEKLVVEIRLDVSGDDVYIRVIDDGCGMDEETCNGIMHPVSEEGMGIAVKNVSDRMHAFFGEEAEMVVTSKLGVGTQVKLRFPHCAEAASSDRIDSEMVADLIE